MDKGVNTIITEDRKLLASLINNMIKEGVPLSVIALMIENVYADVNKLLEESLIKEKSDYTKKQEAENDEQVLYEGEVVESAS